MSTNDPTFSAPLPAAPRPPKTLAAALAHLESLGAVDFATFSEWVTLNPGGVFQLIRALHARLPMTSQAYVTISDSTAALAELEREPTPETQHARDNEIDALEDKLASADARIAKLESELAAAVAERDELRADHARIVTEKFDALIERDDLRARLAAIDAAPTVAWLMETPAGHKYPSGTPDVICVGAVTMPRQELIIRPAKESK